MRLKFRKQASKIKQKLIYSKTDFWQRLTKIAPLTSILLLVIGGWATPEIAQAETARIDNITIERQPDENFESLIGRAEAAARTAVQQGFDQGSQVTDVSVVVLGQNQGIIAPVLVVELSRPEWNNSTQNGITYFSSARSLLRLDEQQLANTNPNQSPGQETPPTPPGGQQNNSSSPDSSREVINSTPVQQSPSTLPGATPLPGGPALTPNPQEPATTPTTSPGDTSTPPVDTSTPNNNPGTTNSNSNFDNNTGITNPNPVNNNTGITNSTPGNNNTLENTSPTPVNNDTPQITGPTPVNEQSSPSLPQGNPSNNTSPNTTPTQF